MQQLRPFSDERHDAYCACCGRRPSTREHVPPKVFLDRPYPANLPVTRTCAECNEGASLDEEYLACWVECARLGTSYVERVERPKVRRLLSEKPALLHRIASGEAGGVAPLERERAERVVEKLARCHAAFELSERALGSPSVVGLALLDDLGPAECGAFERPPASYVVPEVGSRAFQRGAWISGSQGEWITVQPSRYRYMVSAGAGTSVRVAVSDHLAGEVVWT